ncbi:MAG: hypothetical protein WEB52_14520 [Dehalococcoidia bacterium]
MVNLIDDRMRMWELNIDLFPKPPARQLLRTNRPTVRVIGASRESVRIAALSISGPQAKQFIWENVTFFGHPDNPVLVNVEDETVVFSNVDVEVPEGKTGVRGRRAGFVTDRMHVKKKSPS